jgi:dTDP-4-amino-4,6-dideoxygalactose transaminase
MIKFCDIQRWSSSSEVKAAVMQCLDEGRLSGGSGVHDLEKNISAKLGYSNFAGVNSGTSALHLALLAINIQHGEMVAVPSLTFVASASAILMAGATPVFVDAQKDGNINLDSLEIACKQYKIKAVVAVHLYGNPCDVNRLLILSNKYKFKIIEDCSQAIGATVNGKAVGTFGDVGTVSFYASKNLPAGEGGGVICNSEGVFLDVQSRRNHGRTTHYDYDRLGFNYRMSDIFASIVEANLKSFDSELLIRRQQASRYSERFSGMDIEYIIQDSFGPSVFHQFVLIHEKRDEFIVALNDSGIGTSIVYPVLLHTTALFSDSVYVTSDVDCGWDARIANNCFSLPIGNHLDDSDVEYIIDQVIQIAKRMS